MDAPITVTRTVGFDCLPGELWDLIANGERWPDWMVDLADIEVVPGATGEVSDNEGSREVRIDSVDDGERVEFTWWPTARPGQASTVDLHIVPTQRLTILEIVETLPSVQLSALATRRAWARRCGFLGALWRLPVAA